MQLAEGAPHPGIVDCAFAESMIAAQGPSWETWLGYWLGEKFITEPTDASYHVAKMKKLVPTPFPSSPRYAVEDDLFDDVILDASMATYMSCAGLEILDRQLDALLVGKLPEVPPLGPRNCYRVPDFREGHEGEWYVDLDPDADGDDFLRRATPLYVNTIRELFAVSPRSPKATQISRQYDPVWKENMEARARIQKRAGERPRPSSHWNRYDSLSPFSDLHLVSPTAQQMDNVLAYDRLVRDFAGGPDFIGPLADVVRWTLRSLPSVNATTQHAMRRAEGRLGANRPLGREYRDKQYRISFEPHVNLTADGQLEVAGLPPLPGVRNMCPGGEPHTVAPPWQRVPGRLAQCFEMLGIAHGDFEQMSVVDTQTIATTLGILGPSLYPTQFYALHTGRPIELPDDVNAGLPMEWGLELPTTAV